MLKNVGLITAGQFVGRGVQELSVYADTQLGKAGAPAFERPSTWIEVAGGLLAAVGPQYFLKGLSEDVKTLLTVLGTKMVADKVVDLAKEYVPTGAAFYPAPRAAVAIGGPAVAGNSLVQVD